MVAGIVLLIAAIAAANLITSSASKPTRERQKTAAVSVPVLQATPATRQARIYFTGRVIPEREIEIIAEVTGELLPTNPPFKTGNRFEKGETLIRIDDAEERQQLQSQRYRFMGILSRALPDISIDYGDAYGTWKTYLNQIDPNEPLPELPSVDDQALRLYLTGREIYSTYHQIKELELRVRKFRIRAPFAGSVTDASVDIGTLVRANQPIGQFQSDDLLEIETGLSLNEIRYLSIGDTVTIRLDNHATRPIHAIVARIANSIDPATQTVMVYFQLQRAELTPGSYLEGTIRGKSFNEVVILPKEALVRDDRIFTAVDSVARLTRIAVVAMLDDSVLVSGIAPGTPILTQFRQAEFEGTKVAPIRPEQSGEE